jgi:hypothetical protein
MNSGCAHSTRLLSRAGILLKNYRTLYNHVINAEALIILHLRRIMMPVSFYVIALKTISRYAHKPFIVGLMGIFS